MPADFGVMSTELLGERLVGMVAKLWDIIPCIGDSPLPPPGIDIPSPRPFISSPIASWLAFCARLHLARRF